jgi:hypothetical protein
LGASRVVATVSDRIMRREVRDRKPCSHAVSTAAPRAGMVGAAWALRGLQRCCTAAAASARCWIGCLA